jgi:phosphoribosylformylglycinamidine synthase
VLRELWGTPPVLDLAEEAALHKALVALAERGLLASATDISDGGPVVANAKACFPRELGVKVSMTVSETEPFVLKERFFGEIGSSVIISTDEDHLEAIRTVLTEHPRVWMASLGEVTNGNFEISINGTKVVDEPILALKRSWAGALEEQLADEVVTA